MLLRNCFVASLAVGVRLSRMDRLAQGQRFLGQPSCIRDRSACGVHAALPLESQAECELQTEIVAAGARGEKVRQRHAKDAQRIRLHSCMAAKSP